jgi:drug/metabolite transporter (DMT)-like permease
MRRYPTGVAAALAAVLIWGLVPVGTRFFVLRLDPVSFNVIRFLASAAGALPLFLAGKPWCWPAKDRLRLLLCAFLAVPGFSIPAAFAARSISAGRLGLLIATEPICIILFGAWLYRRRVRLPVVVGAVVAFIGVALTTHGSGAPAVADVYGTLLVLVGAVSWSWYTVIVSGLIGRYGPFHVTGGVLVVGAALLIALSLPVIDAHVHYSGLMTGLVGALGLISSLLGFLLWNLAASTVASERLGLFLYLIPIIAVLGGALLLDEHFTGLLILGGTLTIAGVAIGERAEATRSKAAGDPGAPAPTEPF